MIDFEYEVKRKKMKTLRMRVLPPEGRVVVSAPKRVSEAKIAAFVAAHQNWIRQQREKIKALPVRPPLNKDACRQSLQEKVPPLIDKWQKKLGVHCLGWKTRVMKSQWGSCNIQKKTINLNLELGRMPDALLEYVVVHELIHLHEPLHNERFYAWMAKMLPDWEQREQALRTYLLY